MERDSGSALLIPSTAHFKHKPPPSQHSLPRKRVCAVSGADISSDMCLNMVEAAVASGSAPRFDEDPPS
eukprot:2131285-Rhodomonas_salina.3